MMSNVFTEHAFVHSSLCNFHATRTIHEHRWARLILNAAHSRHSPARKQFREVFVDPPRILLRFKFCPKGLLILKFDSIQASLSFACTLFCSWSWIQKPSSLYRPFGIMVRQQWSVMSAWNHYHFLHGCPGTHHLIGWTQREVTQILVQGMARCQGFQDRAVCLSAWYVRILYQDR